MKNSCETCKKLGPSRNRTFIKILSDEDFSSQLEISKEHLAGLKGKKSKFIYFKGPISKILHEIVVKSGENSFLLEQGWKEFAKKNVLRKNDTLYLSFEGYRIFNVAIFDETGREVREKRRGEWINGEERVELNNLSFGYFGEEGGSISKIGKKKALDAECSCKLSKRGRVENDILDVSSNLGSSIGNATRCKKAMSRRGKRKKTGKRIVEESSETEDSDSLNEIQPERDPPEIISINSDSSHEIRIKSGRQISEFKPPAFRKEVDASEDSDSENDEKIEKIKGRAKKFKSNNPSFMKIMETNNVYKRFYLHIPTEFARNHFPEKSTDVSLRLAENERKWQVYCSYTVSSTQSKTQCQWHFSTGWKNFSVQNNLKEGDVCVFELTKREKVELTVHVFR